MPDNGTFSNDCTTGNKNYSDGRRLPIETNRADMKAHPKCKRMKFIKKKLSDGFSILICLFSFSCWKKRLNCPLKNGGR